MNPALLRSAAVGIAVAVATTGCENLSPGENAAIFGAAAGLATAIPLGVTGVNPAITIPVTAGAVALAAGGAYLISKHQATERQRKVAEQRARLYLAQQKEKEEAARRAAVASAQKPKKSNQTRYIAVKTQKESFNQGKESVMIFDTQTNGIVGNQVYDLKESPKVGSVQKFDTYSAEYVGG
ncbi:MAG: hypothetical protein Fur0032_03380 [Terrimicrobiaceae bacterium]